MGVGMRCFGCSVAAFAISGDLIVIMASRYRNAFPNQVAYQIGIEHHRSRSTPLDLTKTSNDTSA